MGSRVVLGHRLLGVVMVKQPVFSLTRGQGISVSHFYAVITVEVGILGAQLWMSQKMITVLLILLFNCLASLGLGDPEFFQWNDCFFVSRS